MQLKIFRQQKRCGLREGKIENYELQISIQTQFSIFPIIQIRVEKLKIKNLKFEIRNPFLSSFTDHPESCYDYA